MPSLVPDFVFPDNDCETEKERVSVSDSVASVRSAVRDADLVFVTVMERDSVPVSVASVRSAV